MSGRPTAAQVRAWADEVVAVGERKVLAWSVWRRAHQHRAHRYHYRKRGARPPD
jgi:hypothetical protein